MIGTLRQTYGQHFANGIADTEKLRDVLHWLDGHSLSQLLRHVVYLGERKDKPAINVRRERPE